jgi:hypothetical protein
MAITRVSGLFFFFFLAQRKPAPPAPMMSKSHRIVEVILREVLPMFQSQSLPEF